MADPGFPRGGGANSPGGAPTYDFAKISQKLHEIERIWTPREGRASKILLCRSATGSSYSKSHYRCEGIILANTNVLKHFQQMNDFRNVAAGNKLFNTKIVNFCLGNTFHGILIHFSVKITLGFIRVFCPEPHCVRSADFVDIY